MERGPLPARPADAVALPARWVRALRALVALGVAGTAVGFLLDPARTWANVLLAAFFALGLGLGGLLFVVLGHVTRAGWSTAIRRVPEAMAATLPLGAAAVVIALAGIPWLYAWSDTAVVAGDHLLQLKSPWLSAGLFVARALVYLACWLGFGVALLRVSRRQDETGDPAATARSVALSAGFLAVFAVTFSLACFDWLMSLEPHWYSTVFALYNAAGLLLAALAAITVLVVVLRRLGPLRGVVRDDHLHDLGKLTLGFSTFWAYLWFCQHMLIWYGHIPEETAYYAARQQGAWGPVLVLNVVVNWLVPFLALLPRPAKRRESTMLGIALLLLAGRWLDLYFMILPPFLGASAGVGVCELAPVAAVLPLLGLAVFRALRRAPLVPVGDPYLSESVHHHA